jgi:hypothetical protein
LCICGCSAVPAAAVWENKRAGPAATSREHVCPAIACPPLAISLPSLCNLHHALAGQPAILPPLLSSSFLNGSSADGADRVGNACRGMNTTDDTMPKVGSAAYLDFAGGLVGLPAGCPVRSQSPAPVLTSSTPWAWLPLPQPHEMLIRRRMAWPCLVCRHARARHPLRGHCRGHGQQHCRRDRRRLEGEQMPLARAGQLTCTNTHSPEIRDLHWHEFCMPSNPSCNSPARRHLCPQVALFSCKAADDDGNLYESSILDCIFLCRTVSWRPPGCAGVRWPR